MLLELKDINKSYFNCAFKYDWICISEFLFDDEADGT